MTHEHELTHRAGSNAAGTTVSRILGYLRDMLVAHTFGAGFAADAFYAAYRIPNLFRRLLGEDIRLVLDVPSTLWPVKIDIGQLEQIILNLVVNARDAMPRGGKLVISTGNLALESPLADRELTIPPGRYVTLQVLDNGCGIDESLLSRIFEPFFTTKEKGKGTGLGLATVYGIVKQSGGYIRVQSTQGVGTSFTVYLPEAVGEEREAEEESRSSMSGELTGKETILLVEDEEMVLELALESLQMYGYTILEAPNGDKALSICDGYKRKIDLLITDLVMPGMNGIELARRFRDSRPGIPVLFMSGYAEDALEHLGDIADKRSFLQKPITPTTLSRKVREMLSVPIPA